MIIEKIDNIAPPDNAIVKVKICGNIAEVRYTQRGNQTARIKKIDKNSYVVLSTGEVREFQRGKSRLDDKQSLKESLSRLRDYLNTAVTDIKKARWLTLTYAEQMSDPERLYNDFKAFNRRCRKRYGHYEFIAANEFQKRGSLHIHAVLVFDKAAPFMDNKTVSDMWQQGFVNIRKLKNVSDVGRYIGGYIGDAPIGELGQFPAGVQAGQIKVVDLKKGRKKSSTAVIKGARLSLMPPGFNLYRISRGIKPPTVSLMMNADADYMLRDWALTYQGTYRLADESRGLNSVISTAYYNRLLGLKEKALFEKLKREADKIREGV